MADLEAQENKDAVRSVEELCTSMSICYMEALEATTMILQVIRQLMEAIKGDIHFDIKNRHNKIEALLKKLWTLTCDEPFLREHNMAFKDDWFKYDKFRDDAAYIARLILYIADRTYQNGDLQDKIEQMIKENPGKGIFPDDLIERIKII